MEGPSLAPGFLIRGIITRQTTAEPSDDPSVTTPPPISTALGKSDCFRRRNSIRISGGTDPTGPGSRTPPLASTPAKILSKERSKHYPKEQQRPLPRLASGTCARNVRHKLCIKHQNTSKQPSLQPSSTVISNVFVFIIIFMQSKNFIFIFFN